MLRTTLGRITVFTTLVVFLCISVFFVAAWSVHDAVYFEPELRVGVFDTTAVSASSFFVFDVETGTEVASKNSTEQHPIASVTKLLTAALFYNDADLAATTSITWSDVAAEGEAGKLTAGDVYAYRELLFPLLLESSNDAAAVLLRVEPGLLEKMNGYVQSLGLAHTSFSDTSGLSAGNQSNAYELSILARTLYQHDPHIFDITKLTQFIGAHTGWVNNNPLVHQEGYAGGKHGFTFEANRTNVSFFTETLPTGQERVFGYILLRSEDIVADIGHLRYQVQQNVRFE